MHDKLNTVLSRRKFQPFKDVLAEEAAEANAQQGSIHSSSIEIDKHQHEPVHAVVHVAKGRR
jgi:predicted NodU family carbamoyl transferase